MLFTIALLFAQILNPLEPQQAYTMADPINADRFGLATLSGRFAVRPMENCEMIAVTEQVAQQNVWIYPAATMPPWLNITLPGAELPGCLVRVEGMMDATPCFATDGMCDLAAEEQPM